MRLVYEHLTAIPANFTEVEYLEASGTQYIDTGVIFNESVSYSWEIYGQALNTGNTDYTWLIGTQTPWAMAGIYPDQSQYTFYPVGTYYQNGQVVSNTNGEKYSPVKHVLTQTGNSSNTLSLTLFARHNNNDGKSTSGSKRIFGCKISKSGVVIRNFIPCLDKNNVPCMYDTITRTTYYNAGTGSFTYGRKIIPVEYLESTGTQWLKTDYTLTANTKIDVLFSPNQQTTANLWVIGSYVASNKLTGVRITGETTIDCYINTVVSKTVSGSNIGNRYQAVLDGKWTVNGSEGTAVTPSAGLSPLTLFGWNAAGTANTYNIAGLCSTKIYHCKICDNGTLARDFIPCKDENNVGFMFDRVTHTAYLNSGTGSFTFGKVMPKKKLRLIRESKRRLPKNFREVEYLQSNGTEYINTGLAPNANQKIELRGFKAGGGTTSGGYIACGSTATANDRIQIWAEGGGLAWFRVDGASIQTNESCTVNRKFVLDIKNKKGYVDSSEYNLSYSGSLTTYPYFLFLRNNGGTPDTTYNAPMRLYYVKIWDNDSLVRDFIPCLDASNVPCLYDLVEGKAYYNAGTGSFTYGHTITPVEYLESTGTQYIDTGVNANSNPKYELKFVISYTNPSSPSPQYTGADYGGTFGVVNGNWQWSNNVPVTANQFYKIDYINQNGSRGAYVNGTDYYQGSNYASQGYRCLLFTSGQDSSGTTKTNLFSAKMKSCSIALSDTIVRDFIPVKDENNVGYMFDKVTHSLYANAGTGSFVVGSELKDITRFLKGA